MLGEFDVFEGDYRKLFDSPANYEKVTREDVQKAAALIFQKNHRTVGVLESPPEGAERTRAAARRQAMSGVACCGGAAALLVCAEPCRLAAGRRARGREDSAQPALRAAERSHHRAGAQEGRAADRVQRFRARRRTARIRPTKPGVGSLVAGLLDHGAGKRSAFEFADAVEGVGGSFNAAAGRGGDLCQRPVPGARPRADDRAAGRCAHAPALRRRRIHQVPRSRHRVHQVGQGLRSVAAASAIYGRAQLFGGHPYGRPQGGSERSLAAITQSDVVSYHSSNFGADRATLVFAGDLDPKWMKQALTTAFGGWAKVQARARRSSSPRLRVTGRRVLLVDSPGAVQTYFWLGNVGVDGATAGVRRSTW